MEDDVQQLERHALPAYDRDRLCVSFCLLSSLDVPVIPLYEGAVAGVPGMAKEALVGVAGLRLALS